MTEEKYDVFLHAEGTKPKVVQIDDSAILLEVLREAGVLAKGDKDVHVFIGEIENDDDGDDEDDSEDKQDPVDPKKTAKELDLRRHRHVHCHRCRRVAVEASFLGKTKKTQIRTRRHGRTRDEVGSPQIPYRSGGCF